MAQNQISQTTIEALMDLAGDDPEMQAILKQMAMSQGLRESATSQEAKNFPGALAKGLQGYMAGKESAGFMEAMKGFGAKKKKGRRAFYDEMFPSQSPDVMPAIDYGGGGGGFGEF